MSDGTINPEAGNALSIDQAAGLLGAAEEVEETPTDEEFVEEAEAEEDAEAEGDLEVDDEDIDDEDDLEAEEDAEDDADLEEEDEDEESEPNFIEVDGEKINPAKIRELREKGGLLEADYRRKTQKLADDGKNLLNETIAKVRELDGIAARFQEGAVAPPDESLIETDILAYREQEAKYQKYVADVDTVNQARAEAQTKAFQNAQSETVEHFKSGGYREEWKDPKAFKADMDANTKYAIETYGYTKEELEVVHDKDLITILDKARRYDEIQTKSKEGGKKLREKPKVVKGSSKRRVSKSKSRRVKHLSDRLDKTGSIEDAAALLNSQG